MVMKIRNITGYVLGGDGYIICHGECVATNPTGIDIFTQFGAARGALANATRDFPMTTIYRVHADEIECTSIRNGIMHTTQANKLIMDAPVAYRPVASLIRSTTHHRR